MYKSPETLVQNAGQAFSESINPLVTCSSSCRVYTSATSVKYTSHTSAAMKFYSSTWGQTTMKWSFWNSESKRSSFPWLGMVTGRQASYHTTAGLPSRPPLSPRSFTTPAVHEGSLPFHKSQLLYLPDNYSELLCVFGLGFPDGLWYIGLLHVSVKTLECLLLVLFLEPRLPCSPG